MKDYTENLFIATTASSILTNEPKMTYLEQTTENNAADNYTEKCRNRKLISVRVKHDDIKSFCRRIDRQCKDDTGLVAYIRENLGYNVTVRESRSKKYKYYNLLFTCFAEAAFFLGHVFNQLH